MAAAPGFSEEVEQACGQAVYRAFDFWVGEWQVHSPDGQLQGRNSISTQEGGCLVLETWTGNQGSTGQSYNYYRPDTGKWHQLWVSQGAIIDYSGGLSTAGAMELEGYIHYRKDKRSEKFSGAWTPQADGSVLQELREWDDKSKAWKDWFIGIYTKATVD